MYLSEEDRRRQEFARNHPEVAGATAGAAIGATIAEAVTDETDRPAAIVGLGLLGLAAGAALGAWVRSQSS